MDELDISGKRYISSKRAARENRYHVDYIGQLIRGGKIVGSKVGRTWYVEVESLQNYLGQEHTPPTTPVTPKNHIPIIKPQLQAMNIDDPSDDPSRLHHQVKPVYTSGLTYLSDDEPLLPQVQKQKNLVNIVRVTQEAEGYGAKKFNASDGELPFGGEAYRKRPKGGLNYAMVVIGVGALLGSLGVSYFLKYDVKVQTANVYTSVHF